MAEAESLLTVGEIARRLGKPIHSIEYVLRTRKIPAAGTAGICRVYGEDDLARIAEILRQIDSRRGDAR